MSRAVQKIAAPVSSSESQDRGPPLLLVHHHPGYLRLRSAAFIQPKNDASVATAAETAAEAVPGFLSWSLNPKTGSVVVEYDPGALDVDDFLNHVAKAAGLQGVELATVREMNREELVSTFLDTVEDVNEAIGELTRGRADLRELVPIALLATSVVSFVLNDERNRLPHWSSALYRGYRIFMHWHRREVRTRQRAMREERENGGSGRKRSTPQ